MKLSATQRVNKTQATLISIEYRACKMFWEKYSELKGYVDNRQRPNVMLKHSFAVAAKSLTGLSLAEVGSIIDKDHASVLHALRKHEGAIDYHYGYRDVYNDVHSGLMKMLEYESDVLSAEDCMTMKELRQRLIHTSQKLRSRISEVNELRKNHRLSLSEENTFLKKHAKEVHERNKKLEKELARVKNLL